MQMRLSVIEQLSQRMALACGGADGAAPPPEVQRCHFAVRDDVPIVTNGGMRVEMSGNRQMALSDKTSADGALYMHLRQTRSGQMLFVLGALEAGTTNMNSENAFTRPEWTVATYKVRWGNARCQFVDALCGSYRVILWKWRASRLTAQRDLVCFRNTRAC